MNATGTVTLAGKNLSWVSRIKNRVIPALGLSGVARLLSTISHTQDIRIKIDGASLKYFNTRTPTWVEVESSKTLASRLEGYVGELNFNSPLTYSQVKSIFKALMKEPIYILGSKLSEYGITVKGPSGEDLVVPVSWDDLYEEVVPVDAHFDFYYANELGGKLAWIFGVVGFLGSCVYVAKTKQNAAWSFAGAASGGIAGYLLGISIHYAKEFLIWAPKRLYNMARFGRDYKLTFQADNRFDMKHKEIQQMINILGRVRREELASTLTKGIDYTVLKEKILTEYFGWKEKVLVSHPNVPKEDLKAFVGSYDHVRAVALNKLKGNLTLSEVQALQNLDKEDVITALLEWDLPPSFFLPYLTEERKVVSSEGGELLVKIFNRITTSLSEANLAAILNANLTKVGASDDFYQTVWNHPKARKEDIVAAAIKWFPPKLIQKVLPLIEGLLQDDTIICLYDAKRLEVEVSPPNAAHNVIRQALLNHPRASKKVGIHIIKGAQYNIPLAEAAFNKFEKEFVENDLEELYEFVNKYSYGTGRLKEWIVAHPNFPRKLRVKVACKDGDIQTRKAALQTLSSPTTAELEAIIAANVNVPEMVSVIQSGSFPLGRSHYVRLCASTVPGIAEKAWDELAPLSLSLDEELYLAEQGADPVRAAIIRKSSYRSVYLKALERGGANVQITALDRVYNSLTAGEIDAHTSRGTTSPAVLERLGKHSQITVQSLARVLCNQGVIPKSKKVVDVPEHTESEYVEDYDSYGSPMGGHYEDRTVPEQSHQEYGEADVRKAFNFFDEKALAFARGTLSILDRSNAELAQALRAKPLSG